MFINFAYKLSTISDQLNKINDKMNLNDIKIENVLEKQNI